MDDPAELSTLTTVPVAALAQPLRDFLANHDIEAFVQDDDTGLDGTSPIEVRVAAGNLARAQALLADYWAANEGPGDQM
jgi:hypothetical protein